MKKLIVFTGAGVSAESGLKTFRDSGGLWEKYDITEVATPEAWEANQSLVLRFYNERRAQLKEVSPNAAHYAIAELEKHFDVTVITQNVDNLHEQAGSKNIIHLHGELTKVRSTDDESIIYDIGYKSLEQGDKCEKGAQLRPHIVWFGEAVPEMDRAIETVKDADIFIVIGSSLQVYPAAGLIYYTPKKSQRFYIDPLAEDISDLANLTVIKEKASTGVPALAKKLCNEVGD